MSTFSERLVRTLSTRLARALCRGVFAVFGRCGRTRHRTDLRAGALGTVDADGRSVHLTPADVLAHVDDVDRTGIEAGVATDAAAGIKVDACASSSVAIEDPAHSVGGTGAGA